jgi:hypothetical protein
MKKIIALAVAGAFVVPAVHAADVTIGGAMKYTYNSEDGSAGDSITSGDQTITVTATEELANGIGVTAKMNILHDTDGTTANVLTDEGSNLTLAFPGMGTLTIGDTASALDSTGDWTDTSPSGAGYGADGGNHALLYKLPTLVDGLTLAVSHSPDGTNNVSSEAGEVRNGGDSYAATYTFSGFSVYYGVEEYKNSSKTDELSSTGIKGTFGPMSFAIETGTLKSGTAATADINYDGVALGYAVNDVVSVGYDSRKDKADGANATTDEAAVFVNYKAGGGLGLFAVQVNDEKASSAADSTHIGVTYAF